MGFWDAFGLGRERNVDATAYAYQGNWSVLRIVNLTAAKSKQVENPQVDFKAFIKSFKDNFNPGWQEQQYPNQSVPIAHQSTPKRTIQIEWTVPSTSEEEAILNLRKCSFLAQSMYPTLKQNQYNKNLTPKSTFMAIKFANLIQDWGGDPLPGYISSFSYTPNFAEGVHVLSQKRAPRAAKKYFAFEEGENYLFPNLVDISIEFKPIESRANFGLLENKGGEVFWNDSSWPYGIQIDTKLYPGEEADSTSGQESTNMRHLDMSNKNLVLTGGSS